MSSWISLGFGPVHVGTTLRRRRPATPLSATLTCLILGPLAVYVGAGLIITAPSGALGILIGVGVLLFGLALLGLLAAAGARIVAALRGAARQH